LGQELEVLGQTAVNQTVVVSSDSRIVSLARQYGAEVLVEDEADGLNAAVTRGVDYARARSADGLLVLPADLPFLAPTDVHLLAQTVDGGQNGYPTGSPTQTTIRAPGRPPVMAICADKAGVGTNALLLAPPVEFTFHYGPDSFRRHLAEAGRRGLSCHVVSTPGLSFDLDTEEDWRLYSERLSYSTVIVPAG
jgi:2-phospho-L-lactate guanylyltransferase